MRKLFTGSTLVAAVFALSLLAASSAFAAPESKTKQLPKSGTLSGSSSSGYGGKAMDGVWGEPERMASESPPISGSVSRLSDNQWQMKVFNNSKDPYSVNLKVVQYSDKNSLLKSDSFSYMMRPGQHQERMIATTYATKDCRLELSSWKNLKKEEKKPAATGAAPESQGSAPETAPETTG